MITYVLMFAVALIVLALTISSGRRRVYVWVAVLLSLMSYPLMVMMKLGQCDLFIASVCVLSLASLRLKHSTCSAILLAIGTLLQGPAIFLLIYFVIFRRDLRYLAHFVIATLLMVGGSLLVIPTTLYWTYLAKVVPTLGSGIFTNVLAEVSNQSLVTYMAMAGLPGRAAYLLSLLGFLLFAVFSFYVSSHKLTLGGQSSVRSDAVFLMNVLLILALSPESWDHMYVWLILPLALFLSSALTEKASTSYLTLVGCATFLVNSTLVQIFLPYPLNGAELPLLIIGNLMLIILLTAICLRPAAIIQGNTSAQVAALDVIIDG